MLSLSVSSGGWFLRLWYKMRSRPHRWNSNRDAFATVTWQWGTEWAPGDGLYCPTLLSERTSLKRAANKARKLARRQASKRLASSSCQGSKRAVFSQNARLAKLANLPPPSCETSSCQGSKREHGSEGRNGPPGDDGLYCLTLLSERTRN